MRADLIIFCTKNENLTSWTKCVAISFYQCQKNLSTF